MYVAVWSANAKIERIDAGRFQGDAHHDFALAEPDGQRLVAAAAV
jgi:hypothetical protein